LDGPRTKVAGREVGWKLSAKNAELKLLIGEKRPTGWTQHSRRTP
jgi:hypothetical protein